MATKTVAQPPVNVSDLQEQFMSHAENVLKNNQLSLAVDGKNALAIEFNQGVARMISVRHIVEWGFMRKASSCKHGRRKHSG
jgi:hypothetical protein